MKRSILFITMASLTGSLLAASPKDEVQNAAKKLSDGGNYSWKTSVQNAGGGGGGGGAGGRGRGGLGGPIEGKISKDGYAMISMTVGENTTEGVVKGDKGAVKTAEGWQSLAELPAGGRRGQGQDPAQGQAQGQRGRGGRGGLGIAARLRNFKAPAAEAEELLSKVKDVKATDGVYSGDLPEDAVKQLLTLGGGRRGGADAPETTNAKGSAKFWVKDGVLSKFEFNVQGTRSVNGNDVNINRTTTVEIKDIGSTKVEVPEEAKKKLS